MGWRKQLPTYLIVTVVAVLIWLWAAGETRETDERTVRIQFTTQMPKEHVVQPDEMTLAVEIEGSRSALQSAQAMESPIVLTLDAGLGDHGVDLARLLNDHPGFSDARISVISTDPATQELTIYKLTSATARVEEPDLGGLQVVGAVVIDPPDVTIHMPQRLSRRLGVDITVKAMLDRTQLEQLNPGEPARLTARLQLPESLASQRSVSMTPTAVTVSFAVRSNIKETTLPTVPVQISGPWKDHDEYVVVVAEQFLENVTVTADAALIDRIEAGEVKVFAFVHISSTEKEQGIEAKPVTYFLALPPPPESGSTTVNARVDGSSQPPLIHLRISARARPQ